MERFPPRSLQMSSHFITLKYPVVCTEALQVDRSIHNSKKEI